MELPYLSGTPKHDHAYAWLFMKGDFYLPGVLVSAYSIRRTHPAADLVAMVTDDVSEKARNALLKVVDHLFYIPYLSYESRELKTERQRELYSSWIASSYSKWNCLALPYKKIILIDGDTIHTTNTDELFELQAPAMPLASPFVKPYGRIETHYHGKTGYDGYPEHGTLLDLDVINDILTKGGALPTSSPALIEPSLEDYEEYKNTIKAMQPFGFPACHTGFDEQSISYYYTRIKKKPFTVIHQKYNCFPWKDGFLFAGEVPRMIHFFSDTKPWAVKYNTYDDVITWYKMAAAALNYAKIDAATINIKEEDVKAAVASSDPFINKFIKIDSVLDIHEMIL